MFGFRILAEDRPGALKSQNPIQNPKGGGLSARRSGTSKHRHEAKIGGLNGKVKGEGRYTGLRYYF